MRGGIARRGGTLIEVMIGVLILMVLAVAGGSYLAESRGTLAVQRNKASALAVASGRLEALRGMRYSVLTNGMNNSVRYVSRNAGGWSFSSSDPGETWSCSGMNLPMITRMQYDELAAVNDALKINVEVAFRPGRPDRVTLETYVAP